MSDVFPIVSTVSLKDSRPGSIIRISRHDGAKLALVTDQTVDNIRSLVWLNPNFPDKAPVIFAEKWRIDPPVLQYDANVRFELGTANRDLDPTGYNSRGIAGGIISIGPDLFIRASPYDEFYGGRYRLVNIRNGAEHSGDLPDQIWTYLAWQLWIRDPLTHCDSMLTEFRAMQKT